MKGKKVATVHGEKYTYYINQFSNWLGSYRYQVYRDDERPIGSDYNNKADAVRRAYKEAGPNAFEP